MPFDLGIEGGTVVTSAGRRRAHIYVDRERVASLTDTVQPARQRFDASGLLVMPGMVDAHVHFMDPSATEREDFLTGSSAAACAGVTTVIEHTHAGPVRSADDLRQKASYLSDRSHVDYALAAHAWPGQAEAAMSAWAAGAAYLKAFTCTTHGISGHDASDLLDLFGQAAEVGATCLVHCEDESLTAAAERRLRQEGRSDPSVIPQWRSREAELAAATMTSLLASLTGADVVIAHASNRAVIDSVGRCAPGAVSIESCPQYLSLYESEVLEHGAFRKFTPPARARSAADLEDMWRALAEGSVDYVATDHAPATYEQKTAASIWDVHFGLPGIDTTLAVLLDGAAQGQIAYETVVKLYSEAPARIYGLRRKGRLAAGWDADLIVVDPSLSWLVKDQDMLSKARWSPLAGRTLTGRAVATFLRGQLVAQDGRILGDGPGGHFISGRGASTI